LISSPSQSGKILRFGPFELDPETQQLRRAGVILRIQPQPFKVLALLVSCAGQVVSRDELRHELWGNEIFVDFEQGLNYCIRQIRATIGDDAQSPRYIETIPRRGYRFIAPVDGRDTNLPADAKPEPASQKTSSFLRGWPAAAVAVLLFAAIGAAVFVTKSYSKRRLAEKDTIVVADFVNSTSNPAFDDILKQALTIHLEQSPFLNILSSERVTSTEKRMNRSAGRLTFDVAREVCIRSNSKATLEGSIASVGNHYLLGVRAINCQTGDSLASADAEAENRDQILTALQKLGNQLRKKLGESLASVNRFNKPLPEATTPSLEALKAYALAGASDQPESLRGLQRAVQLDPNFAVAYASLGTRYVNFGELSLASQSFKKAYELRDRVTERERFYIESAYYTMATGQLEQANQAYRQWMDEYPNDATAYDNLGFNYATMGYYDKCAEVMRKALQVAQDSTVAIGNLAGCYLALGRLDEVKALLDQAAARGLDGSDLRMPRYLVAFLQGDTATMQAQVAWADGKPGFEDELISAESDTAAYYGRLAQASGLSERAVESARRSDAAETAAGWKVNDALRRAELGDRKGAQRVAAEALKLNAGLGANVQAALAWARSGDEERARKLADLLDQQFPLNTMIQSYWLPTIRAALELDHGSAARAIEILEAASPYELGETAQFGFGTMYPVYIRGLAYLKAGQGEDAAAEFQKILDHRSVAVNFPLASLAHLQLARAKLQSHENDAARKAYQDFLALWKNGDPEAPILKQARAEFAKLQ